MSSWLSDDVPPSWWGAISHIQRVADVDDFEVLPPWWDDAYDNLLSHVAQLNKGQNRLSNWQWSLKSQVHLSRVHPKLILVMCVALQRSPYDLRILDGIRTLAEQKELVASKASWTMDSQHLGKTYFEGLPPLSAAVDIGVLVNNKYRLESDLYIQVWQEAILPATELCRVPLVWGGNWKNPMASVPGSGQADVDFGHVHLDPAHFGPLVT